MPLPIYVIYIRLTVVQRDTNYTLYGITRTLKSNSEPEIIIKKTFNLVFQKETKNVSGESKKIAI